MEPNQAPPTQPAVQNTPAAVDPPAQPSVTSNGSSGSKMIWVVLVIVALLIVAAVVGYMYVSGSKKTAEEITPPVVSSPVAKADDLQSQLDSDKVEDVDSDFAQVDQDLQNL